MVLLLGINQILQVCPNLPLTLQIGSENIKHKIRKMHMLTTASAVALIRKTTPKASRGTPRNRFSKRRGRKCKMESGSTVTSLKSKATRQSQLDITKNTLENGKSSLLESVNV